jgi:hypothetical protein
VKRIAKSARRRNDLISLAAMNAAALMTGVGLASSAACASTVLFDFGNDQSFRGATVVNPDSNGNYWNSFRTGVFYQNLVDTTGAATTVDFGFSTPVGTDSYNGPAGPTTNWPLTQGEIDACDIDQSALGVLGVKAACVDYVNYTNCRFEIQQLDPAKKYNLTFFGSHKFSADDATVYSVYSDNTYTTLVASGSLLIQTPGMPWLHNRDTTLTLSNLSPQTDNILYVDFIGSAGNFGYLNCLALTEVVANQGWIGTSGDWNTTSNWGDGVPNAANATALFAKAGNANETVTSDIPVTVGTLRFNSLNNYTINGFGSMTLQATGSALIDVLQGNQNLNLPTTFASNTNINVASGATLKISDPVTVNSGVSVTQSGAGPVSYESTVTVLGGGSIAFGNSNHVAGLTINSTGIATLNAGNDKALRADAISISGRLDLKDNRLITPAAVGSATGSVYSGVSGLVQSGRNGGNWSGNGIVTSQTQAIGSNYASIGVARASDVRPSTATATALWNGQTITGTDTLVMYTYGGDATLDGKINIDDYVRIDSGIAAGLTGWSNGDFNYDGKVSIDDYITVIDANIGNQGPPLGTSAGLQTGVTAIPEPATGVGICLVTVAAISRRRRTR